MVVANKFQTGFDQPLLAGMFLDKPVVDRNAMQTVSRLNRSHEGKQDVVVVAFTNTADAIRKALREVQEGHALRARGTRSGAVSTAPGRDFREGAVYSGGRR